MSTDHQQYSLFNQSQFISKYASENGMNIIHTYDDSGKSGVTTNRRDAFHQLIDDVVSGRINIKAVLVYDISRFGRFQKNRSIWILYPPT
ncbi:recombinase family protein [Pectobacterium versatile]|uniref:recombinase family protein n=1 Tax=Pectobacterium versatile TaxID=2488639 RepID=UPI00311A2837